MRTIRLLLAFEGTAFSGFQRQANARTVQGEVETALATLCGHTVRLRGASRTDAGVHARGLVASFQTPVAHPLRAFHLGTNALLPDDVAVLEAVEAPPDFDARAASLGKLYTYRLWNARSPDPLQRHRAWHLHRPLDRAALADAWARFAGVHDFSAFRAALCDAKSTEREMWRMDMREEGDGIVLAVCGNAFLRNMVRIMVGTAVEAGKGKRPAADVTRLLAEGDRRAAGETAPPQGLTLERVFLSAEDLAAYVGRPVRVYK